MICAIHQPNIYPWLGYFDKANKADVFVFLNQVDYEKSGHSMQSICNRVGILKNGKKGYMHIPVERKHGAQKIDTVIIKKTVDWQNNILQNISIAYKNAPFCDYVIDMVKTHFLYEGDFLSEFNISVIRDVATRLGINTPFIRQDELQTTKHSNELLAEICCKVGCNQYLYGGGAAGYQDDNVFKKNGIEPVAQDFHFPYYEQKNDVFVPGLSIVDTLMWIGIEETKQLLEKH